jgi:carboxyl-terminal processing protease
MFLFSSPVMLAVNGLALAILAIDLLVMLRYTVWAKRAMPRLVAFLPALAMVFVTAHWMLGISVTEVITLMSLPLYVATLVLCVATAPRAFRRNPPAPAARFRFLKAAGVVVCAAMMAFSTSRVLEVYAFMVAMAPRLALLEADTSVTDLSQRAWPDAFEGLVDRLRVEYPFTSHKRIDWDALETEFAPRIAAAAAIGDDKACYRVLREFAWRIPDGHVGLDGDDYGLRQSEVGGSYGVTLARIDDGRLLASSVSEGGAAARAGIRVGAELVSWNAAPVARALAETTIIWSDYPPATNEGRELQRVRFLGRGPVGSAVEATFRHRAEPQRRATLTATALPLSHVAEPGPMDTIFGSAVEATTLPSGFQYIRIKFELPTLGDGFHSGGLRRVVARLTSEHAAGVIVDVRDNLGGESAIAANMLGLFQPRARVFHRVGIFDRATHRFREVAAAAIAVTPREPRYDGPVAVLIDDASHSAAEDLALVLRDLPNAMTVGLTGTHGSGGTGSKSVRLPGGLELSFPKAQSLGASGDIEVDSDYAGRGGVPADLRVPLDEAAVDAIGAGRDIVRERAEAWLRQRVTAGR